jgi:hypothetical protein
MRGGSSRIARLRRFIRATNEEGDMTGFFKSLRRGRGDHRDVFAEFAMTLMYLRAEQAVNRRRARLRVVG